MYVKLNNGQIDKYPYSIGQLRKDNPQTSFPKVPSAALLAEWEVFPIEDTPQPSVDHTKNVTEGTPINQNGWKRTWIVADASAEEVAERVSSEAENVRSKRDQLLSATDWTALTDVTMSAAMTSYRQALRDVPQQPGFPFNVTWPTKPE